jgi:hypothetical protein
MTRTTAGTRPAHHFGQAHRNLVKSLKITSGHTLPTRDLTHGLTHAFDSIQPAEMSVLTIVPTNFKEKFFVHFSSHFTRKLRRVSKKAQLVTHDGSSAHSLNHDSITFKIVIL